MSDNYDIQEQKETYRLVIDDGFIGNDELYEDVKHAVKAGITAWNYLTDKEQAQYTPENGAIFAVVDKSGRNVWDFINAGKRAKIREYYQTYDLNELNDELTRLSTSKWLESAYSLADSWDGSEPSYMIYQEYGIDQDNAEDLLDCIAVINCINYAQKGDF